MSFFEFPNTRTYDSDLGWIIKKIDEINTDLSTLEERVLAAAIAASKEYVDEQMESIREDFAAVQEDFRNLQTYVNETIEAQSIEFNRKLAQMQADYNQFTALVQAQITTMSARIDAFQDQLTASIIGVNARTDLLIEQNNEYILEKVAEGIVTAKVLNYFTGDYVTVQEMFNYLASLHANNAISYADLRDRDRTYTELAALNITYTQLAMNGNILII